MYVRDERIWFEFLDQPLSRLEDFGVSGRLISTLEELYGIVVKDITFLCPDDVLRIDQIGRHQLKQLQQALAGLLREVDREITDGFAKVR